MVCAEPGSMNIRRTISAPIFRNRRTATPDPRTETDRTGNESSTTAGCTDPIQQASLGKDSDENFAIVFAAMGAPI